MGAGFIDRVLGQARLREDAKKAAEEAFTALVQDSSRVLSMGGGFIDRVLGQARIREEEKKAADEAFHVRCYATCLVGLKV